jgi:hypothetical protein
MSQLKYDWQRLWTIRVWCEQKHVCELTYVGGSTFTPHTLSHILEYNAHLIPPDNITHITLSSSNGDLGHENDHSVTG